MEIFDSCEVCWQEYLDKDEFEKRRPAKVKTLADKKTPYIENSLLHYLDTRSEAITDSSKEWQAFRIDYIEWVRDIPLELRSENAVYQKMLELYKYIDGKLECVNNALAGQAVWNATQTATINCMQGQIAQLFGLTKLVVPNTSVCPGWGNVTITPSTTTTGA